MDVLFALALSVDENVIEIHYYEDVELLGQDLVDVTLKRGRYISQSEWHDLVLEMAVADPESRLLFVAFPDPHSMVGIGQIELDEPSSPA